MRGHVVKRARNSWSVVLDAPRVNGKRKRQWITVRGTRKAAEAKLTEMLSQVDSGYSLRPERVTVGQYLDQWLDAYAANNVRPRTALGYRNKLTKHVIPRLGSLPLRSLEPGQVDGIYTAMLIGGLSARSVLHVHRILHKALSLAVSQGYIARNPCQAATPPRPDRKEMRWLTAQELQRVLDAARKTPYYAAFYTLLFTGLRRGELLGLRVRDIDLTLGTIHVSRALQSLPGGQVAFTEPKTASGRRTVALTPSNAVVLRDHLDGLARNRSLLGLTMTDDTLVFSWPDGRPILPSAITHNWIRLVRRVGLPGVRLHDARHTHASLMLAQNVHPKVVQERLGHASIAITLDLYSHAVPGLQASAAVGFDQAVQTDPVEAPVVVG